MAQRPADLPPVPEARTGTGKRLGGDYSASTPFSERLEPGQTESGWLRYTRADRTSLTQLRLTYRNVTTDGYSTVGTLVVVVDP
jgi:hypothetical protein